LYIYTYTCTFCDITYVYYIVSFIGLFCKRDLQFFITDVFYSYLQEQPAIWREIAVLLARTFQSDLVVKSGVQMISHVCVCVLVFVETVCSVAGRIFVRGWGYVMHVTVE